MRFLIVLVAGMFATFLVPETEAQQLPLTLDKGWTIPLIGKYGRSAVVQDEMLFRLTTHSFRSPHDADTLIAPDGVIYHWKRVNADDKGWFKNSDLRGGYLYAEVKFSKPSIAILEATGQQEVFVNGTPRGGDVYGYGWIQHPVKFHRGNNVLLFHVARGRVKASVTSPPHPVFLSDRDLLIPDWITDTTTVTLGAVRVINATNRILKGWIVRCMDSAGNFADIAMPPVSSLSSRKVKFKLPNLKIPKETVGHTKEVKLILLDAGHTIQGDPNGMSVRIQVKTPRQKHKKTFVSEIDGSVQYFSIVPSSLPKNGQALFLTLHGASVEAVNQANAYKSKDWGTIVAPTNRRPYGFDWEDWGRLDAMEVLQFAIQQYHPDPDRIYLTGHSM
ncbi:MAG: hypothetical protein J7L89_00195, partial [Bacteroidales bacterium]|nr:hypothetical protein [Bacteroidales bacterium]